MSLLGNQQNLVEFTLSSQTRACAQVPYSYRTRKGTIVLRVGSSGSESFWVVGNVTILRHTSPTEMNPETLWIVRVSRINILQGTDPAFCTTKSAGLTVSTF